MRTLNTLVELDEVIRLAESEGSDDGFRSRLSEVTYAEPKVSGIDPFSDAYKNRVLEQYQTVYERPYGFENEHTAFDFQAALSKPFPYQSQSPSTISDYCLALAFLIRVLDLPAGSRVADMGPGWGNSTELLARCGYDVTAYDINADFCRLTEERLKRQGLSAKVISGDFFRIETSPEKFDAVTFFECFHHCIDHDKLLDSIYRATSDGAVIAFCGEPIVGGASIPWGLRLDGLAMWSIRKHGWLELGFSEDYFAELLLRHGWAAEKHELPTCGLATTWLAKKLSAGTKLSRIQLPRSVDSTWATRDANSEYAFSSSASVLPVPAGCVIDLELVNFRPKTLTIRLNGKLITFNPHQSMSCTVTKHDGMLRIEGETWKPSIELSNIDMRELGIAVESIRCR